MPLDGTTYTDDKILNIIDRVDKLICDEAHWGIGTCGRTKPIPLDRQLDRSKGRFCPVTALTHLGVFGIDAFPLVYLGMAAEILGGEGISIPSYNNADDRTFEEIKHLIATARALRVKDMAKKKVDA